MPSASSAHVWRWLGLALVALSVPGCAPWTEAKKGASPLSPFVATRQTIGLDIFFARYPAAEEPLHEALWSEVDEQQIPLETRRRLASNGFRAGVVGPQLPAELEKLLKLTDAPESGEIQLEGQQLADDAPVRQRYVQAMAGKRTHIICTGEQQRHAELSVLTRGEDGAVAGKTFQKVMGIFATRAFNQTDGRIRLELLPEIEHGESQRRFEPSEGMMRVDFGPAREKFDALRLDVNLSPGQMLVVAALPDRPGTLGHHYFTEAGKERQLRKLLVIRPSHGADADELFTADAAVQVHE